MAFKMGFTGVMSTVLSFIRPPIGPTGKTLDSLDSPCGAETAKFTLLGSNISHPPGVLEDDVPFTKVGYASSLEGVFQNHLTSCKILGMMDNYWQRSSRIIICRIFREDFMAVYIDLLESTNLSSLSSVLTTSARLRPTRKFLPRDP